MTHRSLTWLFIREIFVRLLLLAIGVFVVLLVVSWIFPQLNLSYVKWVFSTTIFDPIERWGNSGAFDKGDKATVYIGIMGILFALLTFILSATVTRQSQRKQSTLQILIESRFSPNLHKILAELEKNDDLKEANQLAILNYHEFLAAGVIQRNLDEAMLKKTIRGSLCRATYKWKELIHNKRVKKDRETSYENLVAVYWRWRDESREDEGGNSRPDLGSEPHPCVSVVHKFLHSRWLIYILTGLVIEAIVFDIIYFSIITD